jgi:hypothetical protein
VSTTSRHIEVVYCDDIREEIGNKVSYMGIYSKDLFVPTAPVVLPKLCIAVKVVTDITDPFKELEVRILKGEDEVELLTTGPIPGPPDDWSSEDNSTFMIAQMAFMLAPYQIDGDTILRVRARTEREDLKGRDLRILVGPPVVDGGQNLKGEAIDT